MKKKISIDQLKPGMYVVSTNRSWLQIPFFRKRIRNMEVVHKLKGYQVTDVVIDTERGIDIPSGSDSQEVNPFLHPEVLASNFEQAVAVHDKVLEETGKMMEEVRNGETIQQERADRQVNMLLDQIMEDPQSMLCVSVLKNTDQYTFNHCVNMSVLALFVGKSEGFSRAKTLDLGKGALLHDIGKCMIPNEVLAKPGRLSREEADIVKTHVERGVAYLHKMAIKSPDVIHMAEQHHERLNGSGYPKGLSGDQISFFGQLAAVMDVYDAITHENYYKNSEDPKCVIEFMGQAVGELYGEKAYQALADCLGAYPPGTLLMLDTGEMAIVYEPNSENPERPRVLLMTRDDGAFCNYPEPVDLTDPDGDGFRRSIVTAMTNDDANFNPFEILEKYSLQNPDQQ